jgi:hypothetical protein
MPGERIAVSYTGATEPIVPNLVTLRAHQFSGICRPEIASIEIRTQC